MERTTFRRSSPDSPTSPELRGVDGIPPDDGRIPAGYLLPLAGARCQADPASIAASPTPIKQDPEEPGGTKFFAFIDDFTD